MRAAENGFLAGRSVMDDALVEQIVSRIVAASHPEKVVLFGSRARGQEVGGKRLRSFGDQEIGRTTLSPRRPTYEALVGLLANVDIMVYTPEEVSEWSAVPEAFVTTAVREGKVLYEAKS